MTFRLIYPIGLLLGSSIAILANPINYSFVTIDYPGHTDTGLTGINNLGDIVGNYVDHGSGYGFLYSSGHFSAIAPPGPPGAQVYSTAPWGINDSGQISGYVDYFVGGSHGSSGFLDSGGSSSYIDYPGTGFPGCSTVFHLDNSAAMVGQVGCGLGLGFVDSRGSFSLISDPVSLDYTWAYGINDSGQIVGYYDPLVAGTKGAFLYSGGHFTNFSFGQAFDINNRGTIVGEFLSGSGYQTYNNLYVNGSFFNIEDPLGSTGAATVPYGINDAGDIVGSFTDRSGVVHGFLATPMGSTPEPSALILLGTTLVCVSFAWRAGRKNRSSE